MPDTATLAFAALLVLVILGGLVWLEHRGMLPAWVGWLVGVVVLSGGVVAVALLRAARPPPARHDASQTPWSAQERAEVEAARQELAEANERLAEVAETTDPDVRSDALADLLNRRGP